MGGHARGTKAFIIRFVRNGTRTVSLLDKTQVVLGGNMDNFVADGATAPVLQCCFSCKDIRDNLVLLKKVASDQ